MDICRQMVQKGEIEKTGEKIGWVEEKEREKIESKETTKEIQRTGWLVSPRRKYERGSPTFLSAKVATGRALPFGKGHGSMRIRARRT